jgi:hypothetical protein
MKMPVSAPLSKIARFNNLSQYIITNSSSSTPEIDYADVVAGSYVITATAGSPNGIAFYGGRGVYQPNSPGGPTSGGNALESVYAPACDSSNFGVTQAFTGSAPFGSYPVPSALQGNRSIKMVLTGGTGGTSATITFCRKAKRLPIEHDQGPRRARERAGGSRAGWWSC